MWFPEMIFDGSNWLCVHTLDLASPSLFPHTQGHHTLLGLLLRLAVISGLFFALCPSQICHHVLEQLSWKVTQQPVTILNVPTL